MYQIKKQTKKWTYSLARAFFLISVGYLVLYPIFYMFFKAITPFAQSADPSIVWVPRSVSIESFVAAFEVMNYPKALLNTLSVQVVSGLIEVLVCAFVAYGFARFNFPEKNVLFLLVILTMIVPAQAIIIPTYLNFSHLDFLGIFGLISKWVGTELRPNILDTGLTFYLPSLFGVGLRSGLFIFIYRQFFKGLPKELEEAAQIDGASTLGTLIKIVFPSSGASFLCVTIFSLIAHWNDFYVSVMYFPSKYPLSVELNRIGETALSYDGFVEAGLNVKMAGCLLFILPLLILYLFLQRKFIQGIEQSGIVG